MPFSRDQSGFKWGRGHQGHGVRALLLEFDLTPCGRGRLGQGMGESGGSPARIQEVKWDWRGRWGRVVVSVGEIWELLSPCICHSVWERRAGRRAKQSKSPQEPLAPLHLLHATPHPRNEVYGECGPCPPPLPDSHTRTSFHQLMLTAMQPRAF